jgi:hypothetical protein
LFDGITYDFKQRVPPNFFAILYTRRQANKELQTVPMRRSACVAFTHDFQLQYTLRWTFESQLSCLRNLRFGGRTDSDLREFLKVDQDDMRKLTGLEKIEFVGIAVSEETKEIVAMMGQIDSRAWLGTGQPVDRTADRPHCENGSARPNATRVVFRSACLVSQMTSDLIDRY